MKRIGRNRGEDGAAAVEFAIVLPVLILLVFGIVEFGFVFNRWITMTHSAREGVRVYSLTGDAAEGELAGEAAAPDLGGGVACTGTSPALDRVQMVCATNYDLQLVIFQAPLDIASTATMRRE
jgi:hypothetical protein